MQANCFPSSTGSMRNLNGVREKYPGYTISVTGLSVIAARNSATMIDKLSRGLTLEIVFVAAFIGLAFRSVLVMLISILPGLFPIVFARQPLLSCRVKACNSPVSSPSPSHSGLA